MNTVSRCKDGRLIELTIDGIPQPLDSAPGLTTKAANLTVAAFRVAAATMKGAKVIAAASEIDRRLAICRGCEHFQPDPMKCKKCGCYLNLKTRLETEHCPIALW